LRRSCQLYVCPVSFRRIFQVRLLAVEEILVRHGVIALGIDLQRLVEILDALIDGGELRL
jgi:hypothetical protein